MTEIADKWKCMAVDLHFSEYAGSGVEMFKIIYLCGSLEAFEREVLSKSLVWYPFENLHWEALQESVLNTAQTAQRYDGVQS